MAGRVEPAASTVGVGGVGTVAGGPPPAARDRTCSRCRAARAAAALRAARAGRGELGDMAQRKDSAEAPESESPQGGSRGRGVVPGRKCVPEGR